MKPCVSSAPPTSSMSPDGEKYRLRMRHYFALSNVGENKIDNNTTFVQTRSLHKVTNESASATAKYELEEGEAHE